MRAYLSAIPLHRGEPFRPVFIVGSGRSGNTLMRRLLMASGQIYIPPETYVLKDIIRGFAATVGGRWATRVHRVRAKLEGSVDFPTFPAETLAEAERRALALEPGDRSLAALLEIFYLYILEAAGSPAKRWGDKTPLNAYALPELHAVFPQAQFVHMIRDGYDVVESYIRMGRYSTIDDAAKRWLTATEACIAFEKANPAAIQTVLYEDLVTHPETTLSKLCPWLGIPFNPESLNAKLSDAEFGDDTAVHAHLEKVTKPVDTSSMGKGRARLGEAGASRAGRVIGARMAALGYRP